MNSVCEERLEEFDIPAFITFIFHLNTSSKEHLIEPSPPPITDAPAAGNFNTAEAAPCRRVRIEALIRGRALPKLSAPKHERERGINHLPRHAKREREVAVAGPQCQAAAKTFKER